MPRLRPPAVFVMGLAAVSRQSETMTRAEPTTATDQVAVVGSALVIVSLWRETAANPITNTAGGRSLGINATFPHYWSSAGLSGGHSLGIFMLAVAIAAIVFALGDAVLKIPAMGKCALGASLLLLGVAIYYPWG